MLWVFSFGRGERTCLAQEMALAYIHLAVGSLLTRCDPHLGDGTELNQDFWFGCMVTKALESHFAANPG